LRQKLFTVTWTLINWIIVGVVLFFLSFHIVSTKEGSVYIPKQHLSFADTMVNLDDMLTRYNEADFASRMQDVYLVERLIREGLITKKDPATEKAAEQSPAPPPSRLYEARALLDDYFRENPVGDGWYFRVYQVESSVNIIATIPYKQATEIMRYPPDRKRQLARAICPVRAHEVWKLVKPGEQIIVQLETKDTIFYECDCN
jgi:hypothetical protein